MNTVRNYNVQHSETHITFDDVFREECLNEGRTAFVGSLTGYPNSYTGLFLITYSAVVWAKAPSQTWGCGRFYVEKYVDIEIVVTQP